MFGFLISSSHNIEEPSLEDSTDCWDAELDRKHECYARTTFLLAPKPLAGPVPHEWYRPWLASWDAEAGLSKRTAALYDFKAKCLIPEPPKESASST